MQSLIYREFRVPINLHFVTGQAFVVFNVKQVVESIKKPQYKTDSYGFKQTKTIQT